MGVSVIPDRDGAGNPVSGSPFSAKTGLTFKGHGFSSICINGQTTDIDWTVPTGTFLFNAVEILNGDYGDIVQLQIIDTEIGTYSTVPDYILNEFGTNWNMRKEMIKALPYDATLMEGMIVRFKYSNNSGVDKVIYANIDLHQLI